MSKILQSKLTNGTVPKTKSSVPDRYIHNLLVPCKFKGSIYLNRKTMPGSVKLLFICFGKFQGVSFEEKRERTSLTAVVLISMNVIIYTIHTIKPNTIHISSSGFAYVNIIQN